VENFRHAAGKPCWAEKRRITSLFTVRLGEIFPEARFIHVLRDGRSVGCSLLTMDRIDMTGHKLDYLETMTGAARYWRDVLMAGRDGSSFLTQFAIPVTG